MKRLAKIFHTFLSKILHPSQGPNYKGTRFKFREGCCRIVQLIGNSLLEQVKLWRHITAHTNSLRIPLFVLPIIFKIVHKLTHIWRWFTGVYHRLIELLILWFVIEIFYYKEKAFQVQVARSCHTNLRLLQRWIFMNFQNAISWNNLICGHHTLFSQLSVT